MALSVILESILAVFLAKSAPGPDRPILTIGLFTTSCAYCDAIDVVSKGILVGENLEKFVLKTVAISQEETSFGFIIITSLILINQKLLNTVN